MLCDDRLVEIAASRFPSKFGAEAAQKDLCSQVHVFTELTSSSLLARCFGIIVKYILPRRTQIYITSCSLGMHACI